MVLRNLEIRPLVILILPAQVSFGNLSIFSVFGNMLKWILLIQTGDCSLKSYVPLKRKSSSNDHTVELSFVFGNR